MNLGIIPARLNSKRFPKKILAEINNKPMVIHTAEQVVKSKLLENIIEKHPKYDVRCNTLFIQALAPAAATPPRRVPNRPPAAACRRAV